MANIKYKIFNNKNHPNTNIIGKTFQNYCNKYSITEKIYIDSKETKLEEKIRDIFNDYTSNLTLLDDIFYIEKTFKYVSEELRSLLPYFDKPLDETNFDNKKTKEQVKNYYESMRDSPKKLSEIVERNELLCSGENLLFLKAIPENGFKIYHELIDKNKRRTHSLLGMELLDFSLIMDLSENIVDIKKKERINNNYLTAIIH